MYLFDIMDLHINLNDQNNSSEYRMLILAQSNRVKLFLRIPLARSD